MDTISPKTLDHSIDMSSDRANLFTLSHLDADDYPLQQESSSPEPSVNFDSHSQSSPAPVIVQSRQAKKRKSWGQELPEPTTNLPPRKRAKTDDEKEQRRIERIKRNRAAAHNSRERKRQETETLAVALARANAELAAYKQLHGPLPKSIILPEVVLNTDSPEADTPAPSLVHDAMSPSSPAESIFQQDAIKQEPLEQQFTLNTLPPAFDTLDSKSSVSLLSPLDPTQHSAAMLCDLQCRSSRLSTSNTTSSPPSPHTAWWANLLTSLILISWQTMRQSILIAMWTISPRQMARLIQASTLRLTSASTNSSTTPRILRSTPRRLALCNTATGLRAPQSVPRLSGETVRNEAEGERAVVARRSQPVDQLDLALRMEQGVTDGDQTMGDDGDEKQGVQELT